MPSPTEITVPQLARLVGTPDCPVLLDIRTEEDFDADPRLVPGAVRVPFTDTDAMARAAGGERAVVYCQKGLKISQGAAALLRTLGIRAETLEGGQVGWVAAGQPTIAAAAFVPGTVWVTRARPKVDRVACAWLIRRFVDRNARFLFVAPSQVEAVSERFGAVPFDIDGARWGHKGELCTFDAFLAGLGLHTEPLDHLARIVRGADTARPDLAPEAAGLLAVSLGLSRVHRDDLAQIEAGLPLYDALYRWTRDATGETHRSGGSE